jgi:hypothetical protein
MLKRLFEKSVELPVGAGYLRFKDLGELEYALKDKTALSSDSVLALGKLSDDALLKAAEAHRSMEERIVDALSGPGNAVQKFLTGLELERVSGDHVWRELVGAIRTLDEAFQPCQKAVLLSYVAYLSAAQDVIRTIRVNRLGSADDFDIPQGKPTSDLGRRQQLLFDLQALSGIRDSRALSEDKGLARMAKGDPVEIQFGEHQSLDIVLAKYRFALVSGRPFLLVDQTGHDLKLQPGKNIIGRSARCSVALDCAFGAVSRKHLIVEIDPENRVRLIDISTLGTFLPRNLVGNKLHRATSPI